jgi:NAD(P)-dependent dehydrogenase (short-subunit alcohol dehydrogenase family)
MKRRFLASIPLGRVGTPAEIAHVIAMLLHEDAGCVTGQIVHVDGGEHRRVIPTIAGSLLIDGRSVRLT